MQKTTRRTILKRTAVTGSLVCALDSASRELPQAQTYPEPRYDLLNSRRTGDRLVSETLGRT
jgi:hypothetical protein